MSTKIKQIIIAIVVIVIAFFVFKFFFGSDTASVDNTLVRQGQSKTFVDGQATLNLLKKLSAVELDSKILSNKTFLELVSFEQPIPEQVISRNNPFAPIGFETSISVVRPVATSTIKK
jgi:hypothetical protein